MNVVTASGFADDTPTSIASGMADPRPEIRLGLAIALLFFVLFSGWSAFAPLDAVANAPGRLVVSGERQTVQHREGGIVGQVLVKEGERVQQGQVLIRLAGADVQAQERAVSAQHIALLAQRARLQAEQSGQSFVAPPSEFLQLSADDRVLAAQMMRVQEQQLRTRAAVLSTQSGVLEQRSAQAGSQGQGYRSQIQGIDEQIRLLDEELAGLSQVAEQGFVSKNRIRALKRTRAELLGQRGQFAATVDQTRGQAGETRLQVLEARSNYLDRAATELREVEGRLSELTPQLRAVRDQLARTEIRAPASGAVVGLAVFTPGGVIAPGQALLDIVPERAPLTVEANVQIADGDDVRVGQEAFVSFDSLHERALPALKGRVVRVSADAFTDEKSGLSFYKAEVAVPVAELKKVEALRGTDSLRAGMPVNVQVPLRKRTALQYAFEPLTGPLRRSFTEH